MDLKSMRAEAGFEIISHEAEKDAIARKIALKAEDGDVIGFGSGSTSFLTALRIGERAAKEGLRISAVPTSPEIRLLCERLSIPVLSLGIKPLSWGFDGADEVDPHNRLIKGRGGAMTLEKLVIAHSPVTYILVDQTKFVTRLGEKHAVPIEALPEAALTLMEELKIRLSATAVALRKAGEAKDGPVVTASGNYILDAFFPSIPDSLEKEIKLLPGVIDSGLFIGYRVEIFS